MAPRPIPPLSPEDGLDIPGYRTFLTPEGRSLRRRVRRPGDNPSDGPDTPMASEEATRAYGAVIEPPLSHLPNQLTPGPAGPVGLLIFDTPSPF
jgi:hypothetical protein